jgi:hypothetical protein
MIRQVILEHGLVKKWTGPLKQSLVVLQNRERMGIAVRIGEGHRNLLASGVSGRRIPGSVLFPKALEDRIDGESQNLTMETLDDGRSVKSAIMSNDGRREQINQSIGGAGDKNLIAKSIAVQGEWIAGNIAGEAGRLPSAGIGESNVANGEGDVVLQIDVGRLVFMMEVLIVQGEADFGETNASSQQDGGNQPYHHRWA